jgi:hypothetical protein
MNGNNMYNNNRNIGFVGIGTQSPKTQLQVVGNFMAGADTNAINSSTNSSIAGGSGNVIEGNYAFI